MSDKNQNADQGDENPWDDDDGARTVATGAPVDLPDYIPSPISNAPPPMPAPRAPAPPPAPPMPRPGGPKKVGKATMIGIAGPAPGAIAPPMRPTTPDPEPPHHDDDLESRQEDGPTMAVPPDALGAEAMASLREAVKRHSAAASAHPHADPPNAGRGHASLDALSFDPNPPPIAPSPADSEPELIEENGSVEETTRSVARDELLRHQQESHVVVGDESDAVGDEATLAVAPGQVDLGPRGGEIAAALAATLGQPNDHAAPAFPPPPPAFPPPPVRSAAAAAPPPPQPSQQPRPGSNPHVPAAPMANGPSSTGGMPASYRGAPPGSHPNPPYDPMMPQPGAFHPGPAYPSSGQHPVAGPASQNVPMSHPSPHGHPGMMNMGPPGPMPPPSGGMPAGVPPNTIPNAPPPWMTQPSPPPQGMSSGFKITPQVIMLAVVGIVCLAIFVVGIVLFVQTKFN
ncbi:MAG: hypothetical protein JST00_34855 [Deltaproteobacteria bacterium]|nr:hypothetical protein [Deltaproteobacteria bacterium]